MAKNIMVLGTASTVGKSIITAALCRIFKQEGYKVAPFKAQNMALNSYVTADGKEMGRAQVVQAEAAGIEPMVEMNPILLKPTSDVGSQVIVNGKVLKNMKAKEYYKMKDSLKKDILKAYNTLDNNFDVIVMEGAGSPAEINLKHADIVNMGMAEMVDAPVILVGDIDKGGVFASLYGTVMLLEPEERKRIKGYIINKFRGDVDILKPGIDMFYEKIKIPCLGVVPFTPLNIDDEDSVTTRFDSREDGEITIGVIKLPYVSNFTDFTVFDLEKDVSVKYIKDSNIGDVDIIVIPGSKNTIKDMEYILNSGLSESIYKCHKNKIPIIGICGGYQILGKVIRDNLGVETLTKEINGLGLLNTETIMMKEKQTIQIEGKVLTNVPFMNQVKDEIVEGYEIHMGVTNLYEDTKPFIELNDGRKDGAISNDGLVIGTYLHGIFDNDNFRKALLDNIREKKGLKGSSIDYKAAKEVEYNKLAEVVKNSLDIEKIKRIMGLE